MVSGLPEYKSRRCQVSLRLTLRTMLLLLLIKSITESAQTQVEGTVHGCERWEMVHERPSLETDWYMY